MKMIHEKACAKYTELEILRQELLTGVSVTPGLAVFQPQRKHIEVYIDYKLIGLLSLPSY